MVKEKKKRPAIAEKQDKKRPKGQAGDKHSTLVLVCMFRRSEADINNSQRATDISCNYFFNQVKSREVGFLNTEPATKTVAGLCKQMPQAAKIREPETRFEPRTANPHWIDDEC